MQVDLSITTNIHYAAEKLVAPIKSMIQCWKNKNSASTQCHQLPHFLTVHASNLYELAAEKLEAPVKAMTQCLETKIVSVLSADNFSI